MCFAAVLAGLAGVSGHASAQANLVNNGSFETGSFASWTEVGNSAFNGVQCPGAAFVPQGNCGAFFGPIGSLGGITQTLATTPSQHYLVSFAFSGDGAIPSQLLVDFGASTLLNLTNASTATPGFRTFVFDAVATGASTLLSFNFRNDAGFMELDNVAVAVIPEPETYALMLAGFGTLLGMRRFRRRSN
jgi:hypothetical protein